MYILTTATYTPLDVLYRRSGELSSDEFVRALRVNDPDKHTMPYEAFKGSMLELAVRIGHISNALVYKLKCTSLQADGIPNFCGLSRRITGVMRSLSRRTSDFFLHCSSKSVFQSAWNPATIQEYGQTGNGPAALRSSSRGKLFLA